MPAENDVAKMKVADLKRELKLRGLATTGNKNELQDRLQTALIDGELSLEDTAISAEDALLDEDAVLTDEEEAKILGADENELLKSPTTTPTAAPDLASPLQVKTGSGTPEDDVLTLSPTTPTPTAKKIVLKRKNSFTASNGSGAATVPPTKENSEPTTAKVSKMSERNPITALGEEVSVGAAKKVAQLSLQERLDMRAKKFGVNANVTSAANKLAPLSGSVTGGVTDEKQIEMLKKRAERFGCVVSSKIAKIDAEEKLLKRKQRFGGVEGATSGTLATTDVWAEKARLRLERFKTADSATATPVEAGATTAPAVN